MLGERVAFIAALGEKHGGPEVLEQAEVRGPVVDGGVEDRADLGVEAHLGVEAVDEIADFLTSDLM